ncbi:MAG TPA: CHAT domain-containing protein [Thermoanaerobaculia bacterium]|nr:CHAT domain-containing protein [Thermoanaerobaculia bacterium]
MTPSKGSIDELPAMPELRATAHDHFQSERWSEAEKLYGVLVQSFRDLVEKDVRQRTQVAGLSTYYAYSLLRLGRLREAVEVIETFRFSLFARNFDLLLGTREFGEAGKSVKNRLEGGLATLHSIMVEAEELDVEALTNSLEALKQLADGYSQQTRTLLDAHPKRGCGFDEVVAATITLQKPFVYLLTTDHGSAAVILAPQGDPLVEVMWMPCTQRDLFSMHETCSRTFIDSMTSDFSLQSDEIVTALELLMQPLAVRLKARGFSRMILLPSGRQWSLPLHIFDSDLEVSFLPSAGIVEGLMQLVQERENSATALLAVADPKNSAPRLTFASLEARAIARLFGRRSRILSGERVSSWAVESALAGVTHLHFACHGYFDATETLNSGIYLSHGERLTLGSLLKHTLELARSLCERMKNGLGFEDLPAYPRLAVLSACRTGVTNLETGSEEVLNFAAGFLQVGIPGVVSALWPVDDDSTFLLMTKFYHYLLKEEKEPGSALRSAQLWLRDTSGRDLAKYVDWLADEADLPDESLTDLAARLGSIGAREPFRHSFYWAGFTYLGV